MPEQEDRYIAVEELRRIIPPVSDMTLWRWQRDPRVMLPVPVKLGADGRNYWRLSLVKEWIRRREEDAAKRPPRGRRQPKAA